MTKPTAIKFNKLEDVPDIQVSKASMLWNLTGSWRYLKPRYADKLPPCNQGCPAGNDVETFIRLIGQGKVAEAWRVLKEENPFPRVCGRVCYHPCERACNRSQYDLATGINALERYAGDHAPKDEKPKRVRPDSGKTVAVIGSGPAGMAAAYHLARMGHDVTVFEALEKPGGLLRYGIPAYRLPKDVLDEEIDDLRALGVVIRCDSEVGKNVPYEELNKFNAVFIASGSHKSRRLKVENEDTQGVGSGLDFLKRVARGEKIKLGKKTIVIGGGNTAIDSARCALRLGSEVEIYYQRSRAEMPAFEEEVIEAENEGVKLEVLSQPVKIVVEDGKLVGIMLRKTQLGEPDESGRRRPVPVPGSEFVVEATTILTAIGEESALAYLPDAVKTEWGRVIIDEFGLTSHPGVFAGGDAALSNHNVSIAIGSGKKAAVAIDRYLAGEKIGDLADRLIIGEQGCVSISKYLETGVAHFHEFASKTAVAYTDLNTNHFKKIERSKRAKLKGKKRLKGFAEVVSGLSDEEAAKEASRCFHCGVCTECDNCFIFCPDVAVQRKGNGSFGYDIDYDYCKGCGICVYECPRNAMLIEGE